MVNEMKISEALFEASKTIKMDDKLAFDTLKSVLASQGMSTDVDFTPQEGIKVLRANPGKIFINLLVLAGVSGVLTTYLNYVPSVKKMVVNNMGDTVSITVDLSSDIGVKDIYAIDASGSIIEAVKNGNSYILNVSVNGDYIIRIVNNAGEIKEETIKVDGVDNLGPIISSHTNEGDIYTLVYEDEAGIDYSSAYGVGDEGVIMPIVSGDKVIYTYSGDSFTVFIKDSYGNMSEYLIKK